jgi:hypothetical protein
LVVSRCVLPCVPCLADNLNVRFLSYFVWLRSPFNRLQSIVISGGAVALTTCIATVSRYLPSAVTTVLSFRSGVRDSLRDDRSFHVYRFAQDTSTALFGSSLWGLLFSGGIIWFIVSLIAFGFVWTPTRNGLLSFLAQVIGVLVTIIVNMVAMQFLRRTWDGAFYRRHPAGANIFMVFIECWSLALSSGYILGRSLKFILLSILYIARVDTPFLADGVGWVVGDIQLDAYAISFQKDLLAHEAHRHPYMERWAFMYLLKLRYGSAFGTRAGAAWRILFTLALMPWLRNYRPSSSSNVGARILSARKCGRTSWKELVRGPLRSESEAGAGKSALEAIRLLLARQGAW